MHLSRSTLKFDKDSSVEQGDAGIARRISREFEAPVGLLDPTSLAWCAREGLAPEQFPAADAALTSALSYGVLWHGRVNLWRPERDSGKVWLVLPVPKSDGTNLVGIVGFAADIATAAPSYGPPCPDRALRAWGQSFADGLRGEAFARTPQAAAAARTDSNDRLLAARLIRRMRISDSPEQFQELALKALRSVLQAAAVAWVPRSSGEPVIMVGEVPGIKPRDFRNFLPTNLASNVHVDNNASDDPNGAIKGIAVVASDSQSVTGWIVAINLLDGRPFASNEVELLKPIASILGTQRINNRVYGDLKDMLFGIIRALTAAIDAKDHYTSGHSERVARIAVRLAKELGMPASQRGDLYLMGLLHDVGKIGIDDEVLKKSGPLTPDERRLIQSHVAIGVKILSDLKKLRHLLPGVASHHESFDGSGYPEKLAGENIPFVARILAVADSFDAMSSCRPYRQRMPLTKIYDIFRAGSNQQWDPKVVEALFAARADIENIRSTGLGDSLVVAVEGTFSTF